MALNQLPGYTSGVVAKRVSSMDDRVIGKLTDVNHLQAINRRMEPAKYDKEIISLYTQTSLNASDFQQMLQASKPYEIPYGQSDTFGWDVTTTFKFPKIVAIPDSTRNASNIGIDSQEFELVFDSPVFYKGQVITADFANGQEFFLTTDAEPYAGGAIYKAVLATETPQSESVDKRWLAEGTEYRLVRHVAGEFDQEGAGLGKMGDKIRLYESLGAGARKTHTITGWAEEMGIDASQDLIVYQSWKRNQAGEVVKGPIKWEPFIEKKMRDELIEESTTAAIWSKGGVVRTGGKHQEPLSWGTGIYWRMKNNGNYRPFNPGEFSINMLRSIFGDLFYRRVAMKDRRVKMYTNEAGMNLFDQAAKKDMLGAGISLTDTGNGGGFLEGSGQTRMLNFGFDKIMTRETGIMQVIHLPELDLPSTSSEFGQNKMSTPRFMVFDVTPGGDGMPQDNVRLVRRAKTPNIRWAYIDGLMSHLGPMASQGHQAATGFDAYRIEMATRSDVFVEDASRTVLIEQVPQY